MEAEVLREFSEIKSEIKKVHQRLDGHDEQFVLIAQKFESHDAIFKSIDARFDAIDVRFAAVDARFDRIEGEMQIQGLRIETLDGKMNQVLDIVQNIAMQVGARERIERQVEDHEHRIIALETFAKQER